MPIRRIHHLPLLCLLVFGLLTSPASASGYVWCLGADGHATLEEALAGDCGIDGAPAPPAEDVPVLSQATAADDCGPCLDISSSLQWGSTRTRDSGASGTLTVPVATWQVAAVNFPLDPLLSSGLIAEPPPRIAELILHHRTTVLLI